MVEKLVIAYKCINSIGNSQQLEEMLEEMLKTFIEISGAIGGKYIGINTYNLNRMISVGDDFTIPLKFTIKEDNYEVHAIDKNLFVLDILVQNGHLLFCFKDNTKIDFFGDMFFGFKTKIINSIEACYNIEKLQQNNKNLKTQVTEYKSKNDFNEKLMIKQSRMAIMGEMIGMIAHQWRQPITVIGMITNNMIIDLHMQSFEKDSAIKALESIDKQVHYLSRTIDDFRNFFKPNKLLQTISFKDIVKELQTIMGKSFEANGIKFDVEGKEEIEVVTYRNELIQVLLNILTNAKDAFFEKEIQNSSITLSVKRFDSEQVSFFIKDNAGGISDAIMPNIFDPYFSTKNEKNGTGLGLYMSAIIVEKHLGGTIQVCSDATGSVFEIRLLSKKGQTSVY